MMTNHKLFVFGPPRLESGGVALDVKPRKALALLVFLAVTRQPHSRDALATLCWPDTDQQTARASLRRTLYRLSQAVPPGLLDVSNDLIQLAPEADLWTDLEAYTAVVENALPNGNTPVELGPEAINQLEMATQLFQDDFLAGFSLPDAPAFDEWQFFQGDELRRTQARALEHLAHTYTEQGEFSQAVPHVRRRLAMDPLHEPAHRQLMQLYAWAGQHSAAIRQYQECVRILAAELDAPPEDETTALYEAIRAKRLSPPASRAAALSTTSPLTTQPPATQPPTMPVLPAAPESASSTSPADDTTGALLPAPATHWAQPVETGLPPGSPAIAAPTPFIGRDRELDTIFQLLVDEPLCRLLTIVGPGGMGKTRLALQLAERIQTDSDARRRFAEGVCLINLASADTVERFLIATAQAIGLPHAHAPQYHSPHYHPDQQTLRRQIQIRLHPQHSVLILDNFEQLLDASSLLAEILAAAPHLKIVVTSRVGLNLQEAWFYPIGGMSFPRAGTRAAEPVENYEAVRLFVLAARRARVDFRLEGEEDHVLEICRLVEGSPLALELAASWLKLLRPVKIAQEIQNNLDILTSRHQDISPRHRSMRVVLEQSWSMLNAPEQEILLQLALFSGGFRANAAKEVAGASLEILATLVEKSWIRVDENDRYQIHELLRQFALDRLEDSPEKAQAVRQRHCDYFFAYLRTREPLLIGSQQPHILREIREDLENLESAWRYRLDTMPEQFLSEEISSLWRVYWISGRAQEGLAIFSAALQHLRPLLETDPVAKVKVYRHLLQQRALCLYFLGYLNDALTDFRQCIELAERLEMTTAKADAFVVMGSIHIWKGDKQIAQQHLNDALSIFREHGLRNGEADTYQEMARVHLAFGDFAESHRCASLTLEISRRLERPDWIAYGFLTYGWSTFCLGDYATVRQALGDAMDIFQEIGHQLGIAACLGGMGWLVWAESQTHSDPYLLEEAHALVQESLLSLRRIGHRLQISHRLYCLAQIYLEQGELILAQETAQEGMREAEQIGATVFFVGNLLCFSQATWEQGNWEQGRDSLRQALIIAREKGLRPALVNGLYRYGMLRLAESQRRFGSTGSNRTLFTGQPLGEQSVADHVLTFMNAVESGRRAAATAFQIASEQGAGWAAYRARAQKCLQAMGPIPSEWRRLALELDLDRAIAQAIEELQEQANGLALSAVS